MSLDMINYFYFLKLNAMNFGKMYDHHAVFAQLNS